MELMHSVPRRGRCRICEAQASRTKMAERGSAEKASSVEGRRAPYVALALVLALALAVRLIAFRWGLPDETHLFSYHPDEYHSLRGIFALASGDLNPHFFNYGSLYLYLAAAACVMGHPRHLLAEDLWAPGGPELPGALRDWTLDARVVTLVLGVVTVLLVYALAGRMWGHRAGVLAALALAVMPLHVVHSHYATVDVPMTFFVTLTLLLSVVLLQRPTWQNFVWAGVAGGLAASVKYSGALVLIAPAVAWVVLLVRNRAEQEARAPAAAPLILLVAAVVAFALTSPFTFLDWGNAWRDISFEMQHMRVGDDPWALAAEPNGCLFHLKQLGFGAGWLFLLLAGWAAVSSLRARRVSVLPLVVFALVIFATMSTARVRYARYEMALLPVIAVLVGWFAGAPARASRGRKVGLALAGAGLAWAALISGLYLQGMAIAQPRTKALAAIERWVPEAARLGTVSSPWFHSAPVDYCNGGAMLNSNPLWRQYSHPVRDLVITGASPLALVASPADALLLSDFDLGRRLRVGDPEAERFLDELQLHYREVWQTDPARRFAGLHLWPLAQDWLYPFPSLELWIRADSQ